MKSESIPSKLRVCVVGAGRMGADHIDRLTRRIVGADVSAVVDADVSRAKKAVEAIPSAAAVSDIAQALDQEDVNCSPYRDPWFSSQRHVASGSGAGLANSVRETINPGRAVLLGNSWRQSSGLEGNVSRLASCAASMQSISVCEA